MFNIDFKMSVYVNNHDKVLRIPQKYRLKDAGLQISNSETPKHALTPPPQILPFHMRFIQCSLAHSHLEDQYRSRHRGRRRRLDLRLLAADHDLQVDPRDPGDAQQQVGLEHWIGLVRRWEDYRGPLGPGRIAKAAVGINSETVRR